MSTGLQYNTTPGTAYNAAPSAEPRKIVTNARAGVQRLELRSIYWDDWTWITCGQVNQYRRRAYRVRCHACGRDSYLASYNAKKDRVCRRCQASQAGKAGWAASWADPENRQSMIQKLANYQRETLTEPEQIVLAWLRGWGLSYESQVPLIIDDSAWFILDFVVYLVNGQVQVIEINGWHHLRYQADRDRRLELCLADQGRGIIWLDHRDVIAGLAMRDLYQELVA